MKAMAPWVTEGKKAKPSFAKLVAVRIFWVTIFALFLAAAWWCLQPVL